VRRHFEFQSFQNVRRDTADHYVPEMVAQRLFDTSRLWEHFARDGLRFLNVVARSGCTVHVISFAFAFEFSFSFQHAAANSVEITRQVIGIARGTALFVPFDPFAITIYPRLRTDHNRIVNIRPKTYGNSVFARQFNTKRFFRPDRAIIVTIGSVRRRGATIQCYDNVQIADRRSVQRTLFFYTRPSSRRNAARLY